MIADYTEAAVCQIDDLVDGELKEVRVGDTDVLLARADGQYYALHPHCTHYKAPLAKGLLNGHRLICPWHNACFDVKDGHRLEAPALNGLPTHEVRVESGQVFVRLTTNKESLENPMSTPDKGVTQTYVVIGGGGAGAFAVEAMREGGFTGKIIMLTEGDQPPYDRPNCSKNYLQGKATDDQMPLRTAEFYTDYGIEVRTGQAVTEVDPFKKQIRLATGEAIQYDRALICTGGKPNRLPVPGTDLAGVHVLRSWHDSQELRDKTQAGQRTVVIGSSFIGIEGAMSLRKLGSEVDVIGQENVPFEKILGEKVGRLMQSWHEKEGIRFHCGRKVIRLEGQNSVEAVVLDNGEKIPADLVLLGLGVKPRTDFIQGINVEKDGGVLTDAYLQITEDLYAAGDIVHYPTATGSQRIEHWKVAGQQGHIAGLNMAGKEEPYQTVPFFWTNQQGKRLNYIGHATQIDDIVYEGDPDKDDAFLALYVQEGQVRAVAGLQRDQDIIAISELMQADRMPSLETIRGGVKWVEVLKKG